MVTCNRYSHTKVWEAKEVQAKTRHLSFDPIYFLPKAYFEEKELIAIRIALK